MKEIWIEQGNEFKIYSDKNNLKKDNLFYQQYEQANAVVQQIREDFGKNSLKTQEKNWDGYKEWEYSNNIIAFCGERGQGKSSAMFYFTEHFFDNSAWILRTIDPTALESAHSIIDIVVSRLFERFRVRVDEESPELAVEEKKVLGLFQRVHKNMTVLKSEEKFIEREYDYSGSLMRLSEISDSLEMKTTLFDLIIGMLRLEKREYLVIPLDDLDLNITSVYRIMEQLRKYLILPKVIIVMAVNISQLQLCLEREYIEELKILAGTRWDIAKEAKKMANKYLDKVIPFSRRMYLPDVRTMSQGGDSGVHIQYCTARGAQVFNSKEYGIERSLLRTIYERTGLIFVKQKNKVHPIVPATMRELISMLTVIGNMRILKIDRNELGTSPILAQERQENLALFERYFLNSWIENNLDHKEQSLIKSIAESDALAMHKTACVLLNEYMHSMLKSSSLEEISNGDILACLRLIKKSKILNAEQLVFAVNTCFSIRMHQLRYEGAEQLSQFVGDNIWGDYRLINDRDPGDGKTSSRMDFSYSVYDYIAFKTEEHQFLNENWKRCLNPYAYKKSGQMLMKRIQELMNVEDEDVEFVTELVYSIALTSFSVLRNSRSGQRNTLISGNRKMIEQAEFRLDMLFCSLIDPVRTQKLVNKEDWGIKISFQEAVQKYWSLNCDNCLKIVTNMELTEAVASYAEENRGIHVGDKDSFQHYMNFIQNINFILENAGSYLTDRKFSLIQIEENEIDNKKQTQKEEKLAHVLSGFINIQDYKKPIYTEELSETEQLFTLVQEKMLQIPDGNFLRPSYARKDGELKNFMKKIQELQSFIQNYIKDEEEYKERCFILQEEAKKRAEEFGWNAKVGPELSAQFNNLLKKINADEIVS